jgi:hypothetical protein
MLSEPRKMGELHLCFPGPESCPGTESCVSVHFHVLGTHLQFFSVNFPGARFRGPENPFFRTCWPRNSYPFFPGLGKYLPRKKCETSSKYCQFLWFDHSKTHSRALVPRKGNLRCATVRFFCFMIQCDPHCYSF